MPPPQKNRGWQELYNNYKGNHWNKRHNLKYQKYSKVVKGFLLKK